MFGLQMIQILVPQIGKDVRVANPNKYSEDDEYEWTHEEIPDKVWDYGILVDADWESRLSDEVSIWYGEKGHSEMITLTPSGLKRITLEIEYLTITCAYPHDATTEDWIIQFYL